MLSGLTLNTEEQVLLKKLVITEANSDNHWNINTASTEIYTMFKVIEEKGHNFSYYLLSR